MSKKDIVINFVKENINLGKYKPGTRIMSEKDMAEYLGLARMTVREAIKILVDDGIIVKVHGSGNYIKDIYKKKYIIISIEEALANSQTSLFFIRLINYLKIKIEELGYTPYLYQEKHEHYKTNHKVNLNLNEIDINSVAGLFSIYGDKNIYEEFEEKHIPIIILQSEFINRYPGITNDYLNYYSIIANLLEKYSLNDALLFRYDQAPFRTEDNFFYYYDIDKYFQEKYNLFHINQSFNINDIAHQIEAVLKKITITPKAVVFFDDTLFTICQNIFSKYNHIFKNTKIITHSTNNEIYSSEYKVCRITNYIEDFGDKGIKLMEQMINKENPLIVRQNVQYTIINEDILK